VIVIMCIKFAQSIGLATEWNDVTSIIEKDKKG
jgi:hypothetical protein